MTRTSLFLIVLVSIIVNAECWSQIIEIDFEGLDIDTVVTDQFQCDGILMSTVQPFDPVGPRVASPTQLNLYHSNGHNIADVQFRFLQPADYMRFQILDADEPSWVRVYLGNIEIHSQFFPSGPNNPVYTFEFGEDGGFQLFDRIVFDATNSGPGTSPGPEALRNIAFSLAFSADDFSVSSNSNALGMLVNGTIQEQLDLVNSIPPSTGYGLVNRHEDLHVQSKFDCESDDGSILHTTEALKLEKLNDLRDGVTTDLTNDAVTSASEFYVFAERIRESYASDLSVDWHTDVDSVDVNYGGPTQPTGGVIPAGRYITSHILHFDTLNNEKAQLMGSATFESQILGVIFSTDKLNATDSVVGVNGVSYPNANGRAWEIGGAVGSFTISIDGKTIEVVGLVDELLDQMRIITAASPTDVLAEPYVSADEFIDGADEVTFDNCSSAWYRFTFELPANFGNPSLSGIANVDDVAVAYLNGNQITASVDINDLGIDRTDEQGRRLLSWPTTDPFGSCESAHFVPGTNELIFGVVGDLSPFDPTGVEFTATVSFTTVTVPISFDVTRGQYVSGTVLDLASSDNLDLVARRSPSDIQSRAFVEFTGTSPTETPSRFKFTVEASVFARSDVGQSIDLFNYQTDEFEEFDVRSASRFSDQVVTVEPGGDLSRFVEPGTKSVEARVRFQSASPRQQFSANIDQVVWSID